MSKDKLVKKPNPDSTPVAFNPIWKRSLLSGSFFGLIALIALSSQGLSVSVLAMALGIGGAATLVIFGAIKCYELFKSTRDQANQMFESIESTTTKVNEKLDYLDKLRQEFLGPRKAIMEILALIKAMIINIQEKMDEVIDPIQDEILRTLQVLQKTIDLIEQNVSGLNETLQSSLHGSLETLHKALGELKDEHLDLIDRTKQGVGSIHQDSHDIREKLEQTLDKVDKALGQIESAAQGGSDLLAPVRGIGNIIRGIRDFLGNRKTKPREKGVDIRHSELEDGGLLLDGSEALLFRGTRSAQDFERSDSQLANTDPHAISFPRTRQSACK